MDATTTDDQRETPQRVSYLPPSRIGRKALTVHVPPQWMVNLKIYGAKKSRSLQGLVEEALIDLAGKLDIDLNLIDEDDAGDA